jgi:hypothetical protein
VVAGAARRAARSELNAKRPCELEASSVTPEVERARDQSRVFLFAAGRCNEFLSLPSGRQRFLLVPSLVLYAFAAEVGLKAVALHTTGTTKRDHDLQALFPRLAR